MAHIKCRYQVPYCGATARLNYYRKPCDPEVGDSYVCAKADLEYDAWQESICECVYYVDAEFEKTVKNYEIELGGFNPCLKIGRSYYSQIIYLEIDGRILIGGVENA